MLPKHNILNTAVGHVIYCCCSHTFLTQRTPSLKQDDSSKDPGVLISQICMLTPPAPPCFTGPHSNLVGCRVGLNLSILLDAAQAPVHEHFLFLQFNIISV